MDQAKSILKRVFNHDDFRKQQKKVISSVLKKKDTLVIMSTGGGKSLCYQIPALVMDGMCIVISPLISLMKDQVDKLQELDVAAEYLNSSLKTQERQYIEKKIKNQKVKILYVSPEKALTNTFNSLIRYLPINLIAIDEAHLVSHWGMDFREDYAKLGIFRDKYPNVPIIALTASADVMTRREIINKLKFKKDFNYLITSFDRPNIGIYSTYGSDRFAKILKFLSSRKKMAGIIYCLTRKDVEKITDKLHIQGIQARSYHAGLPLNERNEVQDLFLNNKITVICATIAFGMGVDKSDVRWVIHYNMPKNLESYYQEIGRAGRDGKPSDALLFYNDGDVHINMYFINNNKHIKFKDVLKKKLTQMNEYAVNKDRRCRREMLLEYFGQTYNKTCTNCDVCNSNLKLNDSKYKLSIKTR